MPTLIGHAISGFAFSTTLIQKNKWVKLVLASGFCAILPDIDVLAFKFGIPYEHTFGHRGFTHSIFFSLLLGTSMAFAFKPSGVSWFFRYLALFLPAHCHIAFSMPAPTAVLALPSFPHLAITVIFFHGS